MNAIVTLESILEPAQVPAITAAELFGTGRVEAIIAAIETQVKGEIIDISTPAGREAAKSLAYKVARSKTILDEIGKEHVAEIKKQSAAIDAERKTIRDRLDALKDEVRKPVTDWEDAEDARIHEHEGTLVAVIEAARQAGGKSPSMIRELIQIIEGYGARDWQEFQERATAAVAESMATLNTALAAAEQAEAERAELEALRKEKAEREERDRQALIEKQAADARAERERQAQERAERERQEREAQERQRAEQAAQWQAEAEERARIAAEQAAVRAVEEERARAAREQAAQAEADRKRAENARRRNKVQAEIRAELAALLFHNDPNGEGAEMVAAVVDHIAAGRVPHVSINY